MISLVRPQPIKTEPETEAQQQQQHPPITRIAFLPILPKCQHRLLSIPQIVIAMKINLKSNKLCRKIP